MQLRHSVYELVYKQIKNLLIVVKSISKFDLFAQRVQTKDLVQTSVNLKVILAWR